MPASDQPPEEAGLIGVADSVRMAPVWNRIPARASMTRATDRKVAAAVVAVLLAVGGSGVAEAHPHVWIDYSLTAIFADGKVVALREEWRFDDAFTATVLHDVLNGAAAPTAFSAATLASLKQKAFDNLRHYDYFTHGWASSKAVAVGEATGFAARMSGDRLVYDFVVPLTTPVDPRRKTLRFGIWDDTYYVDVGPAGKDAVRVEGSGSEGCRATVADDPDHPIYFGSVLPKTATIACGGRP